MNAIATIEKLPVNVNKVITVDEKKALVKIVEQEFDTKATLYDQAYQTERNRILEKYKESVGFDKLVKKMDNLQAQIQRVKDEIEENGLDINGHMLGYYSNSTKKQKEAIEKLQKLLDNVQKSGPTHQLKSKLIARLWLINTHGEAMVILNQVLGNGIIPQIKIDEIKGE